MRVSGAADGLADAPLATLQIGDRVLSETLAGSQSEDLLLGFNHRLEASARAESSILVAEHVAGTLRATGKHMVFQLVEGSKRSVEMEALKVGDDIVVGDSPSKLLHIRRDSTRLGLSAPLTDSGTLVVDGVVASCYASLATGPLPHCSAHAGFYLARFVKKLAMLLPCAQRTYVPHPAASFSRAS
eukprot:TRINITY_DN2038_c0_g1_i2.p1 TRINITY_DN2038_c0_g1~~TRINITY_DN2038_c0_g1_i2.p1  ORF type:complete len:186 (-),score=18.61 TRINITY_DN2038_c0_g1_i2:88-645(-)